MDEYLHQLRGLIKAELNELADLLANGGANSMEDYRYATGTIKGLGWVLEAIEQILNNQENSED